MPKDKTKTHAALLTAARREFLTKGFEKAALNVIAEQAGITPAGFYRHFRSKDDLFDALVRPVLTELDDRCREDMALMDTADYDPFDEEGLFQWVDFFYEYFDEWRLLICCSHGSRYEHFCDELVRMEHESAMSLYPGLDVQKSRVIAELFIRMLVLPIEEQMTKPEAVEHVHFLRELLYPGWERVFHQIQP